MPAFQSESLVSVSRQEGHLRNTLQSLLDAQSEGLLAGLGGAPPQDEASSSGSRTPTTEPRPRDSEKPRSVVPVRQPPKRKLGLRGARRGIIRAIHDLANLKFEEGSIIEGVIAQRDEALQTLQAFERKVVCLSKRIDHIGSEDITRRVEDLRGEEKTLDHEIRELDSRLLEMKAKQRHLLQEIEGLDNSVQSKLSSYQSALALAEQEARRFLSTRPLHVSRYATGLWALPPERRTLEMVKEQYSEEQDALKKQLDSVERERGALEDGSGVWEEVVENVTNIEKLLREEMQRIQTPSIGENGDGRATEGMTKILEQMSKARSNIQSKLDIAERQDWKLLICCIGAELEAMSEGQSVLQSALEASRTSKGEGSLYLGEHMDSSSFNAQTAPPSVNGSQPFDELGHPLDQTLRADSQNRSEDEDDGPGPDFLISHHDE